MSLYPQIEPYGQGFLEADGHLIYYEQCGNPNGKPAVVLHGGPGSGCGPWYQPMFAPEAYRVVLFDQRNCGRSRPHAREYQTDLSNNTTWHIVSDIERLREKLGIDKWLVFGGSWGSTLGLAYAETHPDRVTEMILFGVSSGRFEEIDWLFRGGLSKFFPEEWNDLVAGLPEGDVVEAYSRLLEDPDPETRKNAATAWCLWESATPAWPPRKGLSPRYADPDFAYAFARLVTHFVRHNLWLEDDRLLKNAHVLADIPGILVNGRFDFQSPIDNAWRLQQAWPNAELAVVNDAGHSFNSALSEALVQATNRFASR